MDNIFLTTFAVLNIFASSGMPATPAQKTDVKIEKKVVKATAPKSNASNTLSMNVAQPKAVQSAPVQTTAPIYNGGPLNDAQIQFLGNCESGMTATRNSGNGYYGAFQFSIGTWNSMGTGYARADMAPLEVQIDAVQRLVSRSSIFGQFPGCARQMRSIGLI